jgi:dTDP-4-dehydrorhamnose 3,5-epimerase-like enzyme
VGYCSGETYTPRFEAVSTGNDINIGIDTSCSYRLVISNRDGTIPVTYGIKADVFWQNF